MSKKHHRASASVVWGHEFLDEGTLVFRTGRRGRSVVAEWPTLATLTCADDGSRVRLTPRPGASRRSLSKLRGVVKALVGDLRGDLGVHAAAVAMGPDAVLLLGESGAGKSTAAAELCLHHGAQLLADDAALLEERRGAIVVVPSEREHYLSRASGVALGVGFRNGGPVDGTKSPLRSRLPTSRAYRLTLVVSLRFDDALGGVVERRIGGAEAAARLLGSMMRFDVADAEARRRELDRVTRVYEQATFLELSRPRARPSVAARIAKALKGAAS